MKARIPSARELIDSTSGGGRIRVRVRGERVVRLCLLCDAEFEQTLEGFADLNAHEFEHGVGTLYNLSELNGKTLRMVVVTTRSEDWYKSLETDVYGIDDETGTVYRIANHAVFGDGESEEGRNWKWKYTKHQKLLNGQSDMPSVAESLLNFFESTDAK